jgi:enoyl-CoA hydratase/carnithine racemase
MNSLTQDKRVLLTRNSATGIATVTLQRADKLNALDMPMFRALAKTARELISDRAVRLPHAIASGAVP